MIPFIVRADKAEEFLGKKHNTKMLLQKFERLKRTMLLDGEPEDSREIAFLSRKIEELKNE